MTNKFLGNERTVKRVSVESGDWLDIDFMDIKAGDMIVLMEPDGAVVFSGKASSDAYFNEDGIGTFQYA